MLFARPPKDLDYSRTRNSEGGRYRATIVATAASLLASRWVFQRALLSYRSASS